MLFDLIFSSHTLSKICDNFVFSGVACIRATPFLRDFQLPANPKLFLLELHPMKLMDSRDFGFFETPECMQGCFLLWVVWVFHIKRSIIYFLFSSSHTHKNKVNWKPTAAWPATSTAIKVLVLQDGQWQ